MNILMVDDCEEAPAIARSLESLLQDESCAIEIIDAADECLAFTDRRDLDLILLDIMMYHGKKLKSSETNGGFTTGLRLLQHLVEVQPKTPICIFTALRPPFFEQVKDFCTEYDQVKGVWQKPRDTKIIALDIRKVLTE